LLKGWAIEYSRYTTNINHIETPIGQRWIVKLKEVSPQIGFFNSEFDKFCIIKGECLAKGAENEKALGRTSEISCVSNG